MLTNLLVAVLIALLPAFILFLFLFFSSWENLLWVVFGLGALGWFLAFLLRILPLQAPVKIYGPMFTLTLWNLAYASILAGLFEEGIRYVLMRKIWFIRQSFRHVTSFGLGWGFGEAAIIYVGTLISLWIIGKHFTFLDMLPGAVERNLAIVIHVALTFILIKAIVSLRFLWFAMGIHAGVDFLVTTVYRIYRLPIWEVETIIALIAIILFTYAYLLTRGLTSIKYVDLSGLGS